MRLRTFIAIVILVAVPTLIYGEMLHLKDGSSIKGRVIRFEGDTLHFRTSFGSDLKVHRRDVVRIEFVESPARPAPAGAQTSAEPGSLIVRFSDMKLSSKISVRRNRDRPGHERENRIEQSLSISGKKAFSHVDTTTDKVIFEGPETVLKNEFEPVEMRVGVPPGTYQVTVTIANTFVDKYAGAFPDEPLYKDVFIDAVVINPGGHTTVQIGKRRKKLGLAGYELFAVTSN